MSVLCCKVSNNSQKSIPKRCHDLFYILNGYVRYYRLYTEHPLMCTKYCIPSSFRLWNSIEDDLKQYQNSQPLKAYNINLHTFQKGIDYMTVFRVILRNNCSSLNKGLFRNHIHVKPLFDLCGVVEDATNYFFIVEHL